MSAPKPPQLRAKDKRGNVRPADGRFLTAAQRSKQDAYVAKVTDAPEADAAAATEGGGTDGS